MTFGPQGQFSLTKGPGLLLSHRVKEDCQEMLSIAAVRNKGNFFLTLISRIFNLKNVGSFLLFVEAIKQWDGYVGIGFIRRAGPISTNSIDIRCQQLIQQKTGASLPFWQRFLWVVPTENSLAWCWGYSKTGVCACSWE